MIVVAIIIRDTGAGVESRITSRSELPTAGELKMLQQYHRLLTDGAARQALDGKRTLTIVDKSTLTFGEK